MTNAHALDMRRRIICAIESGSSCRQVARHLQVDVSPAIRWVARLREIGDMAPKPRGGPVR